jgi:8-oxo-dGTP diphosphatase
MTKSETIYPLYEAPILTIDAIVLQVIEGSLYVLLIKRIREPFAGMWSLPGVYVPKGETTRQAFTRVLHTKAGVEDKDLGLVRQLYASDTVARDPRGHAVSIAYLGLGRELQPVFSPTVEDAQFFPVSDLPELAFDHRDIITNTIDYLRASLTDVKILSALLPKKFTLTQLQGVYETLLGYSLDKRNFRKKIATYDLVEATSEYYNDGAHRPAQLYRLSESAFTAFAPAFASH